MLLPLVLTLLRVAFTPVETHSIAIVGATIIDGTGAEPIIDGVVVIQEGKIRSVGQRRSVSIPPDAIIVNSAGKWIVPGLIDMHVHLDEDLTPSAFPLFGVTSVRDVGSRLITIQKLRSLAVRGIPMPRIYWMGRNIDEGHPSWWGAVAVKSEAGVPALLDDMAKQGVDGVKLYTNAGPTVTKAVIENAHRRGWPVTAHLERTKPSEAARFGIDNLEHASTLLQELRKTPAPGIVGYKRSFAGIPSVDLGGTEAKQLIRVFVERKTAVTPTLTVSVMPAAGEVAARKNYSGWADMPGGWSKYWKTPYWSFISTAGWTGEDFARATAANKKAFKLVHALESSGVSIVAGTDTPAPWVLPGAGLIHELELLVEAGLTPMSAIRSATGRAARILKDSRAGTIRQGSFADLVILDGDPLRDIHNLRKIDRVYMDGREIDRAALRRAFNGAVEPPPGKPP